MSGSLMKASYFPSLPLFKSLFLLSRVMGTGSRFRKSELPAQGHWDCLTIISFSVLILSYNLLVCFSKIKLSSKRVNWALYAGPGQGQASSRLGCSPGCVSVWNCLGQGATWAAQSQGCRWLVTARGHALGCRAQTCWGSETRQLGVIEFKPSLVVVYCRWVREREKNAPTLQRRSIVWIVLFFKNWS